MPVNQRGNIFHWVLILLYVVIFIAILQNLRLPYLWFDESVQFWIAKGLNPNSEPFSATDGLTEVIENNKYYNMDPGGFSIFLHFWTNISNASWWLRIVPLLFFIGSTIAFIVLGRKWFKNTSMAMLLGFVPLLFPMFFEVAFEVRAYSMEMLGILLTIVAIEQLKTKITNKKLLAWSMVLAFFLTSRYSIAIVVFFASFWIIYQILKSPHKPLQKLGSIIIYGTPLLLVCWYNYSFAFIYQNPGLQPLFYSHYLHRDTSILTTTYSIVYLLLTGVLITLFGFFLKQQFVKKHQALLYLVTTVNIAFLVLSFLGKHPWNPASTRSLAMVTLTVVGLVALGGEFVNNYIKSGRQTRNYLVLTGLMVLLFFRSDKFYPDTEGQVNTYQSFQDIDLHAYNSIYVDRWETPYIKYLFEYGSLPENKKLDYPQKFTFAKSPKHCYLVTQQDYTDYYSHQPKMNDLLDYDLLITPELFMHGSNDQWELLEQTDNFWVKKNQ